MSHLRQLCAAGIEPDLLKSVGVTIHGSLPPYKLSALKKLFDKRSFTRMTPGAKYLEVGLEGNLIRGMYDTGSNVTIISSRLAK